MESRPDQFYIPIIVHSLEYQSLPYLNHPINQLQSIAELYYLYFAMPIKASLLFLMLTVGPATVLSIPMPEVSLPPAPPPILQHPTPTKRQSNKKISPPKASKPAPPNPASTSASMTVLTSPPTPPTKTTAPPPTTLTPVSQTDHT